jgi:hypothetical protein
MRAMLAARTPIRCSYSLLVIIRNPNTELRQVGGNVHKSPDESHNGTHLFVVLPRVGRVR